jgi:hypothetical protein
MTYSAWGVDGCADTFIEGTVLPDGMRKDDPGAYLIATFEADSWEEAMRQYHEWQGWEPYKPLT